MTIFDKEGESIGGNGPPSIVFSTSEERFDRSTTSRASRPTTSAR